MNLFMIIYKENNGMKRKRVHFSALKYSFVVLLVLVSGAIAWAGLLNMSTEDNQKSLNAVPREKKEVSVERNKKTFTSRSLVYYYLNPELDNKSNETMRAKSLLFKGSYDEAIEEFKKFLPTGTALVDCIGASEQNEAVCVRFREILTFMAAAYELKENWGAARKIYVLLYGTNASEISWFDSRRDYAKGARFNAFAKLVKMLGNDVASIDVGGTLKKAEESKDKPDSWLIIPIDQEVRTESDLDVYRLKDRLARVACPKLHFTFCEPWVNGGSNTEDMIKQAELSHESYLKFLESMEEEYERYKAQDPSTVRPELQNAETVEKVMTMLRKIGELPY